MPKPDWLIESEQKKQKKMYAQTCEGCDHFGKKPVKYTRYKNNKRIMLYECDIHEGCMCNIYSLGCEDRSENGIISP